MPTILDTLITRFGFETDTSGLDEAKTGLGDFKENAIKIAAAIGTVLTGSFFLVDTAMKAVETQKFADGLGIAVEKMSEMDFIAKKLNVNIESLRGQAFNLTQALNEAATTGAGITDDLTRFGLSAQDAGGKTKSFTDFIDEVRVKMLSLSAIQRADLADKLFFDEETIALLTVAPERISELTKEAKRLGVLTRQDAVAAQEFVSGLTDIGQAIEAIKFEVGGLVFEPLAKMFKIIANGIAFFRKHKEVMLSIIGVISAVAAAYTAMGIKAAIAWIAALGPISAIPILIGLAGIAIAILTEDFIAFFKGQESALGDLVKKWPLLGEVIFFIRDLAVRLFSDMVEGFGIIWNWIKKIGGLLSDFLAPSLKIVSDNFNTWLSDTTKNLQVVLDWIKQIGSAIKEFIDIPMNTLIKTVKKIPGFDRLVDLIGLPEIVERKEIVGEFKGLLPVGPSVIPGNVLNTNTQTIKHSSNQIRVGTIKVDARGGDSKDIAQNVDSALKTQLKNTVEDFDSAIAR